MDTQLPRAAALGAGPEVRRAHARATPSRRYKAGDTVPLKNTSRAARARGRLLAPSTARRGEDIQHGHRGLRRRVRRPRPVDQRGDRGPQPVLQVPHAGDADPRRPGHPARQLLPSSSAARPRRSRPVAAHQRACCSPRWPTRSRPSARDPAAPAGRRSRRARRREDVAIRSFRVQRPFLADFADLSARLRPAVQQLPVSLPRSTARSRSARRSCRRRSRLNRRPARRSREVLETLFENPNTLLTLKDLHTTLTVTRAGRRVHRALPDRLQLRRLLLHRPRASTMSAALARPVGARIAEPGPQVRQPVPAEQLRDARNPRATWTSCRATRRRARRRSWASRRTASRRR